jgi:DNA-binding ferritin-like protein
MTKSRKNKNFYNKTMSRRSGINFQRFQREITIKFIEMLTMVKLYHWKTYVYATHKATDNLYDKLNDNIDSFIEVLLGKTGMRTNLMGQKNIRLIDLNSPMELKREIMSFKSYLVSLNENKFMNIMANTDLYNIRDAILADLNQFLYLLTFK